VAMACGRHFVNHGVNTVEPFSANSHKAGPTAEEVKTWPGWAQSLRENCILADSLIGTLSRSRMAAKAIPRDYTYC